MTTPENPAICADCRHCRFDGLTHWCRHPARRIEKMNYLTGRMDRADDNFCAVYNLRGECSLFSPAPPLAEKVQGVVPRPLRYWWTRLREKVA